MGKFTDRFMPKNGVRELPVVAPVPEGQSSLQSGTFINGNERQILIKIFDGGKPEDLANALGMLEIAKDIVKQTLTQWHVAQQQQNGIIVPKVN